MKLRDLEPRARLAAYATGAVFVAWLIVSTLIDTSPLLAVVVAAAIGVLGGAVIQAVSGRRL